MLISLLLLALGIVVVVGLVYHLSERRNVALARLERRLAVRTEAVATVTRPIRPFAMPAALEPVLARAQIELTPRALATLAGAGLVVVGLAFLLTGPGGAVAALLVAAGALAIHVRGRARRRTEKLIEALPFYLDNVRQLMSVGNSLSQALLRALPSAEEPVRAYLGTAIRRIELGAPVGEAVEQLAERLRIAEVSMLASSIRVNLRFGGSMHHVLGNLVQIMRERLRIKRELASATAETRMSTKLLLALPLALVAFLFSIVPAYRHFFFHEPRGHHLAAVALTLQALGMMVMLRLQRLVF